MNRAAGREPRVVAILAAFNEADVIGAVLDDLARQRVEVHFIDNGSTDGTFELARERVGKGVIGVERFPAAERPGEPGAFDWTGILRRKEELAVEIDADWFVHHDADEFREGPWDGVDLRAAIARVDEAGYNAIDFALYNFRPEDDSFVAGSDPRAALRRYEPGDWWDAYQVKCWKKLPGVRPDLATKAGHEVLFAGRRVFPIRFLLLHYPIRSEAHGRRKVEQERLPRFLPAERAQGWHLQYDAPVQTYLWRREDLREFDPVMERIQLQLHNRLVDEMRTKLGELEGRLAAGRQEEAELRRALATRVVEPATAVDHEALSRELEVARREAEERSWQIADRERELAELSRSLLFLEGEVARLGRDRQTGLQERILELEQYVESRNAVLEGILASTSWRLTAPIRRLSEWRRRRSGAPGGG